MFRNVPKMGANEVNGAVLSFDRYKLSVRERLLTRDGEVLHLTPRVFDLLVVLVRRAGEVVTKEELLEGVWADVAVEEGNINRTVSTLRKHLGKQSNGNDLIETIPKVGYRFLAPVTISNDMPRRVRPGRGMSLKGVGVLAALVLVAATAAGTLYLRRGTRAQIVRAEKNIPIRLTNSDVTEANPVFTADGRIRFT